MLPIANTSWLGRRSGACPLGKTIARVASAMTRRRGYYQMCCVYSIHTGRDPRDAKVGAKTLRQGEDSLRPRIAPGNVARLWDRCGRHADVTTLPQRRCWHVKIEIVRPAGDYSVQGRARLIRLPSGLQFPRTLAPPSPSMIDFHSCPNGNQDNDRD